MGQLFLFDKLYNIVYILYMLAIGQRFQAVRLDKGMTQAALVERAGIPQSALSNIERGKHDLTVSTLIRLCSALEISPAELFAVNPKTSQRQWITRERIEKIARAVWGRKETLNLKEENTVLLLRDVVPMGGRPKSQKRIHLAWNRLRRVFDEAQIRILTERVRGEDQRRHAKKPD